MRTIIHDFYPVGAHVENGSLGSAVELTPPSNATRIMMQAFTQNVRFTLDGSTPDANTGFQLKAADPPIVIPVNPGTAGPHIQVIQEAATAVLQYQWGRSRSLRFE
jgi:hypothetical protein